MFCPRCSQEQASAELRFCSRCGLPLTDIAEALAGGGYVQNKAAEVPCSYRRPICAGIFVMLASFAFLIVSLIIGTPEPSFVVQWNFLVSIGIFLAGFAWATHQLSRGIYRTPPQQKAAESPGPVLEGRAMPTLTLVDNYSAPAAVGQTTRELDKVPSVVEHTTRTLRRENF